jgi:hypothetical protein
METGVSSGPVDLLLVVHREHLLDARVHARSSC